jgi:hypothetical protein
MPSVSMILLISFLSKPTAVLNHSPLHGLVGVKFIGICAICFMFLSNNNNYTFATQK